jgi:hypothetical protein
VGCGEIDGPVGFGLRNGEGDCGSGSWLGDHQGRDTVSRKNFGCHAAEGFSEKARIAAHDDLGTLGLLRGDIARNAGHRAAHVGKGELLSHYRPPTGGTKFDLSCHERILQFICEFRLIRSDGVAYYERLAECLL